MISVTVNGRDCWLILDRPDWRSAIQLTASIPTEEVRGLTGREARRPKGASLRCRLTMTLTLRRERLAEWRNAWQSRQGEPLLVPLWPAEVDYLDYPSAPITGGLTAFLGPDEGDFEVAEGVSLDPAPSGGDAAQMTAVPVLWCRAAAAPRFDLVSADTALVRLDLEEDGPTWTALQIPSALGDPPWVDLAPALAGRTWSVVPLEPDWNGPVAVRAPGIELDTEAIGRGREIDTVAYPQAPARQLRFAGASGSMTRAAALLRWLLDTRGTEPCWAPSWVLETRLTADAVPSALTLATESPLLTVLGSNRWVAACRPGLRPIIRQVANDGTLVSAFGVGLPAGSTLLTTAALCRLLEPEIVISWENPAVWTSSIALVEIPAELVTPIGETHGESLGALPLECHLLEVTIRLPEASELQRWTDHESDVESGGWTFTARKVGVDLGGLRRSLSLERSTLRLEGRLWSGCPLAWWITGLEGEVEVRVGRAAVVDGAVDGAIDWMFQGVIRKVRFEGPRWTADVEGRTPWDRTVPRLLVSTSCSHRLFDARCGVDRDDWEFSAEIANVSSDGRTIGLTGLDRAGALSLPDPFAAGFFAGGWVTAGTGANARHRVVAASTAPVDGDLQVTLQRALVPAPTVGQVLRLWPGCDGQHGTCVGRFANGGRFGGFPFAPAKSPSFQPLKKSSSTSGKK